VSDTAVDLLRRAVDAERRKDLPEAARLAGEATKIDVRSAQAWRLCGLYREKIGDYAGALDAYGEAQSLAPEDAGLTRDLARLASLLNMPELAERFLLRGRQQDPGSLEIANDLAYAYCAQSRFSEAIGLLQTTLTANPGSALLWNTLGCVLFESGQAAQSLVFFDEALRLQNDLHASHFNRANARKAVGDIGGALQDAARAIALGGESLGQRAMYRYAQALLLLTAGEIGAGWDAYDVRNEEAYPDFVRHELPGERWRIGQPLAGRRMLVVGEQGLGDEVLFANVLGDVARDLGPDGRMLVAVEPRLVSLFQRSFPDATVVAYDTRHEGGRAVRRVSGLADDDYDAWAPIGDFLRERRRELADFPTAPSFLRPDPDRVEHWRGVLAGLGAGPKVGVIWRSLLMTSQRQKFYPPLDHWPPVFTAPGLTFVSLQLGESAEELRAIAQATGVRIHTLPGIDLRNDLDEIAALCAALDVVVGPATATTNIAAAAGAETWFATTPDAWPRLGAEAFPWYPRARAFVEADGYHWDKVMARIGEALRAEFPARR